jgi:adiponectin receptor
VIILEREREIGQRCVCVCVRERADKAMSMESSEKGATPCGHQEPAAAAAAAAVKGGGGKRRRKGQRRGAEAGGERRKYKLVSYQELPDYMKENEFILNYYRSEWPILNAVLSLFSWHNETINIWT